MLIHELTLRGILSFGPETLPLTLRSLNVFIGPNGSGKSNLIEAIDLLRSSATGLASPTRGLAGGGVSEWLHKGTTDQHAAIEAILENPPSESKRSPALNLRHRLEFGSEKLRFVVHDESIENQVPDVGLPSDSQPFFFYRYQKGHPYISVHHTENKRELRRETIAADESILSQRREPDQYPELAYLAEQYSQVKLYRDWSFGRRSPIRLPQPADLPSKTLEEDLSNFGSYFNNLRFDSKARHRIFSRINEINDSLIDVETKVDSNTIQLYGMETHEATEDIFAIPSTRLSDGTIRFLCLLAILSDSNPPSLVCIEEPELGLHPDLIVKVGEWLIDASSRTQIIVTTHSDVLVDTMKETPESIVVTEKKQGCTHFHRLEDNELLQTWIDKYSLGETWSRGLIGGNRW